MITNRPGKFSLGAITRFVVVAFTATIMLAGIAPASATSTCPSKRVVGSRMSLGEFVKTGAPNTKFGSRWWFC